ncbi:MAG: 6-phosphogluconolactonase [Oleiphilus sp.]|nr:MAG: 6-phosphogluconolactonase [Oleiphilus sp.]
MQMRIFESSQQLVASLADELQKLSELKRTMHIALSGGSTPKRWFDFMAATAFRETIDWQHLHFWWGDERCVGPEHEESNFGEADRRLFQKIQVTEENLHRIHGESDPQQESERLTAEMKKHLPLVNGLPQFDWVLLGIGEDGHTASLFPHQYDPDSREVALVAQHPESGQARISISAAVIENARRVSYLVLGASKQSIVKTVLESPELAQELPAARIRSQEGTTEWLLDAEAAALLPR